MHIYHWCLDKKCVHHTNIMHICTVKVWFHSSLQPMKCLMIANKRSDNVALLTLVHKPRSRMNVSWVWLFKPSALNRTTTAHNFFIWQDSGKVKLHIDNWSFSNFFCFFNFNYYLNEKLNMVQTGKKTCTIYLYIIETSKLFELNCLSFNKEFVFYQFKC